MEQEEQDDFSIWRSEIEYEEACTNDREVNEEAAARSFVRSEHFDVLLRLLLAFKHP